MRETIKCFGEIHKHCASNFLIILAYSWLKVILSKVFEAAGKILIGLQLFLLVGGSFLYIGVTSTSFRLDGKLFDSIAY